MSSNRLARCSLVCFLVASQLCAAAALAAPGDDAPGQREARARYSEGATAYEKGEFETAYVKFSQAFTVWKVQATRWNLAKAAMKTGRQLEAIPLLEQLLDDATLSSADRGKVEADLAAAKKSVGVIAVLAAPGASVSVDASNVGSAPLRHPLAVQPGTHVVTVISSDPESKQERQVRVLAGESVTVDFAAATAAAGAAPVQTPPAVQPPRDEKLVPHAGRPMVMGVLGGLAVASLGTGLATFLVGNSARSEAKDPSQPASTRFDAVDRAGTMRTVSMITTYAGVGLAVATLVPLVIWPKKKQVESALRVTPLLGPSHLGVRVTF